MNLFSTIPFFRILIPFIGGILLGVHVGSFPGGLFYLGGLVLVTGILVFYKRSEGIFKITLLALMDVFLLLYGMGLVNKADVRHSALYYANKITGSGPQRLVAVINDLPVDKGRYLKCNLQLLELKSGLAYESVQGEIIAYFRRSAEDTVLKAGTMLLVKTNLLEVPPPMNPQEFDYKNYLAHRQIYHTAFIDAGAYVALSRHQHLNPVWEAGLRCKSYLLSRLKQSPLSPAGYAICSALLTGYDDEIDRPVMDAFAHTGTLHVLSVSGLHTGLLYLALGFLFDLADRKKKYRLLRFIIINLALWLFALITGFSAPVLRAVVMFSLLGLGKIYFRHDVRNQLNILCVSAFMLLCCNPFFITDIGFQLSYFALAGLIYLQPKFTELWLPDQLILRAVWQSITASVAATISTLPLTLFYFKQFPLWFPVCNIVVIPATFVLLLLAGLVALKVSLAAYAANYLVAGLLWFINLFSRPGFGFIDGIDFNGADAVYLSLLILAVISVFQSRVYRRLVFALVLLIGWQLTAIYGSYTAKRHSRLLVYQVRKKSIVGVKSKTVASITPVDTAAYRFHVAPGLISFNNPTVRTGPYNFIQSDSLLVLLLNRPGFWPAGNIKEVSTVVVSNNFKLNDKDLAGFKKLRTLVADGSNNSHTIKKTEELCRKFGLGFYATKNQGAYELSLDQH